MRQAYSLLAYCAVLPLLAYLWWRGRSDPAYRQRWGERFGHVHGPAARQDAVLVHCASVGEVLAARPLIDRLLADPRWGRPLVTCTTPTGARQVRKDYAGQVDLLYFPLDLPGATRRFLRALRPRLVILLERELWPNFLQRAQALGVPVVLVNARLSARSAAAYARWHRLVAPALASLRLVCCEDDATAARFAALGVAPQRLAVTGNIKSDVRVEAALAGRAARARQALGNRPVLVAGSTHAGEDEALIAAFVQHLPRLAQTLLVLVPRHPERFDAVAALLQRCGLRFVRHGRGQAARADTQVVLGDTMGELMGWYALADACFVGGSLIPRGGHNPLEAVCLDKPLLSGPHTANFAPMYDALESAQAMLRVRDAPAVFEAFRAVLAEPEASAHRVARARAVYRAMAGATDRTLARLAGFATPVPAAPLRAQSGAQTVWVDPDCFGRADPQLFDPRWWRDQGDARALAAGRGRIHQVADARRGYLLRHYYRGGLMARISSDLFLARPLEQTRAMAEFTLLARLRARGLPVPRACAARHARHGLWYRADILVERIAQAQDVARLLHQERALTAQEWQALGRAVRRLHDEQVFHADLNCHNLMLDAHGGAWIVDFDKCGFRAGTSWKRANLARLLRSLRKERSLDPGLRWREADWQPFLAGYQDAPAAGAP